MKKYEPIAPLTTKRSRNQKTGTRLIRRLILVLAILSFSSLTIYTVAQERRGPSQGTGPKAPSNEKITYLADLIPLPRDGVRGNRDPGSFCYGEPNSGKLTVRVHNQGEVDTTRPFLVKVTFAVGDTKKESLQVIDGLRRGTVRTLQFAYPTGCFAPDCNFSISVDFYKGVQEKSESNNIASGRCVG